MLLYLKFDDLAPFLDHQHLGQPLGKAAHALRLQRPGHPDLVDAQADARGLVIVDPQLAQRLARVLVGFARCNDAEPGVGAVDDHAIHAVCPAKRHGGIALVGLQPMILYPSVVRPADVQPALGHLEIVGQDEGAVFAIQIDGRRRLDRIGDDLHPDPCAGIARHGDAQQAHLDEFMHR